MNAMGKRRNKERGWGCWHGTAILNNVVRNSFIGKVTLASDLKEVRKLAVWISGKENCRKVEQPVVISNSGNISGVVLETLRRAVWLAQSEHEVK